MLNLSLHKSRRSTVPTAFWEYQPQEDQAFINFMAGLERIPRFAHHPTCGYYNHHILYFWGHPVCLGCSMITIGMITGTLILILAQGIPGFSTLPFQLDLVLGVLLYVPALFQIWHQHKLYKVVARFLLGASVSTLMYGGLIKTSWDSVEGWILKLGFITIFTVIMKMTLAIRQKYSKLPCENCPDGRFPICSYTHSRIPKLAYSYSQESTGNNSLGDEFVQGLLAYVNQ